MAPISSKFKGEGLTFDDVLIIPAYSKVVPREVDLSTRLTRRIKINVPIISAAMDTVTESKLAIAIAREGGVGILHKNMSIELQADEVRKVKRAESGILLDPITLYEDDSLGEAKVIMTENRIGGIPIINRAGVLIGIVTNRDLRFETNLRKKIGSVMTKDKLITAPPGTSLAQAEKVLQRYKIEKLPIVDKKGKLKGLITYKDILRLTSFPLANKDKSGKLVVGAAVGVTPDIEERTQALVDEHVDFICIDTAHGHSKGVIDTIRRIKKIFNRVEIIAGNIGTADAARDLIKTGIDALKVGIGPGSICTTRVVTGAGLPQLTAVYDVAAVAKKSRIPVIADGGIRYSGDIVKAIAAGADTVMAGSIFAGVEESPGETIIYEGRKFKSYRGMGSLEAMQQGSKDRYFQDVEDDIKKLVPEGIVGRIPYKGSLSEVFAQYIGGLQAGMGYSGAPNIKTLQKAKFIKITTPGILESHPHDVIITSEAPNYSR